MGRGWGNENKVCLHSLNHLQQLYDLSLIGSVFVVEDMIPVATLLQQAFEGHTHFFDVLHNAPPLQFVPPGETALMCASTRSLPGDPGAPLPPSGFSQ